MDEAMAKVLRLSKQQQLLDNREQEMIRRGLETLDELDQAEAAEKEELARQEASALALSEASAFLEDPLLDPVAFSDLPDRYWENLGFPGESDVGISSSLPPERAAEGESSFLFSGVPDAGGGTPLASQGS
jgi:hypothetical protein